MVNRDLEASTLKIVYMPQEHLTLALRTLNPEIKN